MAFRPDAPMGFQLSIEVTMDPDASSLGIAMSQIYNPLPRGGIDVETGMSGTVKK